MARPKPNYERLVLDFWPKPHPQLRVGERTASLASPCHPPAPTISCHHPTPPFHTARLKLSYECSVSGFWPKPHLQLRVGKCAVPPAPPYHPPALPSPIISPHRRFTRHTRNRATNTRFWVFGLNLNPGLALANAQPPRHLRAIHLHPQPPIIVPTLHFIPHGRK
jgi:hypothetical protein